ncbi:MAG: hypothetical protein ABIG34_04970 [Candidatus Peregrinibacteria bacterium]
MNMKMLRYRQYESALPMLVARELIRRGASQEGVLEFHTLWFPDTTESTQLEAVMRLKQEKVIVTSDIVERKEDHAGRKYELKTEPKVPRRELVFQLQVLPELERYYEDQGSYTGLITEEEMSIKKMSEGLKTFLEERSSALEKTELSVTDEELDGTINPFLAATYLEMKGAIEIIKMLPPARHAKSPTTILQIDLVRPVEPIETSRMKYDSKERIITLKNRKPYKFPEGDQSEKILYAMCFSENYFLSKQEIVVSAQRGSLKNIDANLSKQLIKELKEKLGIKAGSQEDIIESVRGEGYQLIK